MITRFSLTKTVMVLAIALGGALPAHANDRYANRPPIVVSPDLTAPWLMQLGGQPKARVVYRDAQPRVVVRRQVVQQRAGQPVARRQVVVQQAFAQPRQVQPTAIEPQFLPQMVAYDGGHQPGTVIIDTNTRFLYLVTGNGQAKRYGVGVGKPGFEWAGAHRVTRKAEWPTWTPPAEMRAREAKKGKFLPVRMDGGPANPLGARALYLGSTLYRIHGTNAPWTIGSAVSSGCIRMRNEDVVDLYERVPVGAKVIVI